MAENGLIELPIGVFLILREIIRERIGISFDDDKRELLGSKLSERLHELKLTSFLDYYYLLKYRPEAEDEWPRLTNTLSVQETYFWREFDQIRVLISTLLPAHVAANRGPIRIWCAACATGEEPFSIAIALAEAGWFDRADISIWASDISTMALEKARKGLYRERSLRALPEDLREKYFARQGDLWKLAPELHARIQFFQANLLEPQDMSSFATARYIFCRNVFIYFSTATIRQVVGQFTSQMPRPGYLFVGASESLLRAKTSLELQEIGGAFVYVQA